MDLKEIMLQNNFVIVGNTLQSDKYACIIKNKLEESGYKTAGVYKELTSINEVDFEIDVLDLCINPVLGLKFLEENKKPVKCVVIQPGAESDEIKNYLESKHIDYIEGCLLVGLKLYPKC